MHFQLIKPPLSLAAYVKAFWVMECDTMQSPYLYHAMADGNPELVFHYYGRINDKGHNGFAKRPDSYVLGQTSTFSQQISNEAFGIFGAYLYPYTIPAIFSLPASELSNEVTDLVTLLGREGVQLEEQIMLAADTKARVKILSIFLEQRIHRNMREDKTIAASVWHIMRAKGRIDVKTLAGQFGISTRQFERKFKEHSGFSPKLFSRITRFQFALNEIKHPHKRLTDITYECGYYDQSHFIHDFKEFSGVHPKLYFSGKAEGTEIRASI